MNFNLFENSNFFKSAKLRTNPVSLEQRTHYISAFEWRASDCIAKIDTVNSQEYLDDLYFDFQSAIKMTLPNPEVWIPEEFRTELYRQYAEVRGLIKYTLDYYNNNPANHKEIKIIRSRLIMGAPGLNIHRHHHDCPMTITFCYKFDENSISSGDSSHLILGPYNNTIKVYVPNNDKFCFVMKNSPMHGAVSNEWRFWWISDLTELFDIPELPFPKWENKYLDNNNF
jgi:hypothetical protein